ncbi:Hypothetical protein CINCED_3A010761 [Cinara cedri]|uniref:P-loop containing nucleoside triphosphate hydrolase n=1 Tax=Cinara cedri TaxID=506608 RepID=A0A5E4NM87_9HEMI|nr:Hypothetical protein CINCED_3A010761 [Cinara cedri]
MTINKAQSQTLNVAGLELRPIRPMFLLGSVKMQKNLLALESETLNMVYPEIFNT